jgi:hypothetical protein
VNFSNRPEKNLRLALGSFIEDTQNKVEIIALDEDKGDFVHQSYFDHEYPPSKIMWIPDLVRILSVYLLVYSGRDTQGLDGNFWRISTHMGGR